MDRTIPDTTLSDKENNSGARTIRVIRPIFVAVLWIVLVGLPKTATSSDPIFEAHEAFT